MNGRPGCSVTLSTRAARTIECVLNQVSDGCETGGILLGSQTAHAVFVAHAGGPGPQALRTPTSFLRDLHYAQSFATACWNADQSLWVGEWHSHPTALPVPSQTDLDTYKSLLADDQLGFDVFVSLIVSPLPHANILAGYWCDSSGIRSAAVCLEEAV